MQKKASYNRIQLGPKLAEYIGSGPYYKFGEEPEGWKPQSDTIQKDFWNYTRKVNPNAKLFIGGPDQKIHLLPCIISLWDSKGTTPNNHPTTFGGVRVSNRYKKDRKITLRDERTMRWNHNHICKRCGFTGRNTNKDCPRCHTKESMKSSPWWKKLPKQKKDWRKLAEKPWCETCKEVVGDECYCQSQKDK